MSDYQPLTHTHTHKGILTGERARPAGVLISVRQVDRNYDVTFSKRKKKKKKKE